MRRFVKLILAFTIFILVSFAHAGVLLQPSLQRHDMSLSLRELLGTEGFVLQGPSASKVIYLPTGPQRIYESLQLKLYLYHVTLAKGFINLTFFINDQPINSIDLSGDGAMTKTWIIDVPKEFLNNTSLTLKIMSLVPEIPLTCNDYTDPYYWVNFSGRSAINIVYDVKPYEPKLSLYPYPFIREGALQKDNIDLVLSEAPSLQEIASAFYVANALYQNATWRGLALNIFSYRQWQQEKPMQNTIITMKAGDLETANFSIPWPDTWQQLMASNDFETKNNTGLLVLSPSPSDQTKAVLYVTGTTDAGLLKAAEALHHRSLIQTSASSSYLLIKNLPQLKDIRSTLEQMTFADLGYTNQSVYGRGGSQVNYEFEVPVEKKLDYITLRLKILMSDLLSNLQKSSLTIKVNDTPIGSYELFGSNSTQIVEQSIKNDATVPGKNKLSLVFNLNILEKDCTPETDRQAWATVYADSSLQFAYKDEKTYPSFKAFFRNTQNLTVVLPNDYSQKMPGNFNKKIIHLSKRFMNLSQFSLLTRSQVNVDKMIDHDFIYFGQRLQTPLSEYSKKELPFYFDGDKFKVHSLLKEELTMDVGHPVALIQSVNSPLDNSKQLLIISAISPAGYELALDVLVNSQKYALLRGDAVLIYENGTFTSIEAQKLLFKAETYMRITSIGHRLYLLFLAIMITVVIAFAAWMIGKSIKRYFMRPRKK